MHNHIRIDSAAAIRTGANNGSSSGLDRPPITTGLIAVYDSYSYDSANKTLVNRAAGVLGATPVGNATWTSASTLTMTMTQLSGGRAVLMGTPADKITFPFGSLGSSYTVRACKLTMTL